MGVYIISTNNGYPCIAESTHFLGILLFPFQKSLWLLEVKNEKSYSTSGRLKARSPVIGSQKPALQHCSANKFCTSAPPTDQLSSLCDSTCLSQCQLPLIWTYIYVLQLSLSLHETQAPVVPLIDVDLEDKTSLLMRIGLDIVCVSV